MKIKRERWGIVSEDGKQILCGRPSCMSFRNINNVGNAQIRTYQSENRAYESFEKCELNQEKNVRVIKLSETLEGVIV